MSSFVLRYIKIGKDPEGVGAYGYVYHGLDTLTNQDVAMKRIRLEDVEEGVPRK